MISMMKTVYYFTLLVLSMQLFSDNSYAADGDLKWTYEIDRGTASSPAIGTDGTLYIRSIKLSGGLSSSGIGQLIALNTDGTEKWVLQTHGAVSEFSLPSKPWSILPAVGPDGTIYVGGAEPGLEDVKQTKLAAVDRDGNLKWTFNFTADDFRNRYLKTTPAIAADGTIYVGVGARILYAINPDGTKKWSLEIAQDGVDTPVIGRDGTIYVVAETFFGGDFVVAINPDGTAKWTKGFDSLSGLVIGSDGTVYVPAFIGGTLDLVALDGTNGSVKWVFVDTSFGIPGQFREAIVPPLIGSDGTIYALFSAIHPDGTELWSLDTFPGGEPVIGADGNLYFGRTVLNPDGTINKIYSTTQSFILRPTLGEDGTLYGFGSDGLSAYETTSNGPASSPWPMFHHDLQRTGFSGTEPPPPPPPPPPKVKAMPWLLLLDD